MATRFNEIAVTTPITASSLSFNQVSINPVSLGSLPAASAYPGAIVAVSTTPTTLWFSNGTTWAMFTGGAYDQFLNSGTAAFQKTITSYNGTGASYDQFFARSDVLQFNTIGNTTKWSSSTITDTGSATALKPNDPIASVASGKYTVSIALDVRWTVVAPGLGSVIVYLMSVDLDNTSNKAILQIGGAEQVNAASSVVGTKNTFFWSADADFVDTKRYMIGVYMDVGATGEFIIEQSDVSFVRVDE